MGKSITSVNSRYLKPCLRKARLNSRNISTRNPSQNNTANVASTMCNIPRTTHVAEMDDSDINVALPPTPHTSVNFLHF